MMSSSDDDRPPVGAAGLARFAESVAALMGTLELAVEGPGAEDVVAALRAAGMQAAKIDVERGPTDVVISLGAANGSSLDGAVDDVERLTVCAQHTVVFSPAVGLHRFVSWWDHLFAERGFEAHDVLRGPLWEDPGWDAAVLTGLTVYSRPDAPVVRHGPSSPIPRSAIHPGMFVVEHRDSLAARELATRHSWTDHGVGGPVPALERWIEASKSDLEAVRTEAKRDLDAAMGELERAERAESEARQEAGRERHRRSVAEEARDRALAESRLSRMECDRVVATAAAPHAAEPPIALHFVRRAADAVGRRVERRGLLAATRLETVPGRLGRLSRRSVAVYRSMNVDWREDMRELFDVEHYLSQRPGLLGHEIDVRAHYARLGWRQGLDPHPLFDTDWYLRTHGSGIGADVNPLEHFVKAGWRDGCDPHPFFDSDFYLRRAPEVAVKGINSLLHYTRDGWREGRDPHPLFKTRRYLELYADVRHADVCPLAHYVLIGWKEGRSPSDLFDAEWYVARYPEALSSSLPPYRYFLEIGLGRGDIPSEFVDRLARGSRQAESEPMFDSSAVQLPDQ